MGLHCLCSSTLRRYRHYGTLSKVRSKRMLPLLILAEFIKLHPDYLAADNSMAFLSEDGGETYNKCHCESSATRARLIMSSLEQFRDRWVDNAKSFLTILGDLNFWRSEPYLEYFDYLDKAGGFYYERWGDAPVHSIAAALFANKSQIHFFQDIGYRHEPFQVSDPTADRSLTRSIVRKATRMIEGTAGVIKRTISISSGESVSDSTPSLMMYRYSCTNKYLAMFQ